MLSSTQAVANANDKRIILKTNEDICTKLKLLQFDDKAFDDKYCAGENDLDALDNAKLSIIVGRKHGPIGRLVAHGKIGRAEALAADRWYEDYALAEHGGLARSEIGRTHGTGTPGGLSDAILNARTSYRKAKEELGGTGDLVMRLVIADGITLTELKARLKRRKEAVTDLFIDCLQRLAYFYSS